MVSYSWEEVEPGRWVLVRHCEGDCSVGLIGEEVQVIPGPLIVPNSIPEPNPWLMLLILFVICAIYLYKDGQA